MMKTCVRPIIPELDSKPATIDPADDRLPHLEGLIRFGEDDSQLERIANPNAHMTFDGTSVPG